MESKKFKVEWEIIAVLELTGIDIAFWRFQLQHFDQPLAIIQF
jgi:hypothetical protein